MYKRFWLIFGVVFFLFLAVIFLYVWWNLPWWRVEVRSEVPGATVKISKWKTAWVLGRLGVWCKEILKINETIPIM